jgi:hypothetical protein
MSLFPLLAFRLLRQRHKKLILVLVLLSPPADYTFNLAGTALTGGQEYTVAVTQNNLVGGGAYAHYDGLALNSVPEPSALLLGGFGLLGFLRRRR